MDGWMTLKEIEDKYGVKSGTLRNYIARNQVIPIGVIEKVGKTWLIRTDWVENKYGKESEKV